MELAGLLGVNPRTIVNWEKDRARPRSGEMNTVVQRFLRGQPSRTSELVELDHQKQEEKSCVTKR